jgi:hypothetical protein
MSFRQILVISSILWLLASAAGAAELQTWPADDLHKVLRTDLPPESPAGQVLIESCRGEIENGQIAFRSDVDVEKLTAQATDLTDSQGNRISAPRVRYLGYVHLAKNADAHYNETGPYDLVARAPVDLPDPLLEDDYIAAKANQTGAVWLTIDIPRETPPGTYEGTVTIDADGQKQQTPIAVKVYDVVLPPEMNLKIVNWYHTGPVASVCGGPAYSDKFFDYVKADAKAMAAHRQSVGYIMINETIRALEDEKGEFSFDFTNFDRMANIYQEAGLPYLMGSHIAGRSEWKAPDFYVLPLQLRKASALRGVFPSPKGSEKNVFVTSDTFKEYVSIFLPALQKHLEEKGWVDIYYQHMTDEPVNENVDAYALLGRYVKTYAPKLKRADANRTTFVAGSLDAYIPLLSELHENLALYKELMLKGSEVWFYTCERPRGVFMNRFIESPLAETRLLHWANFYTYTTGFLHWGYNPSWSRNMFTNPNAGQHPVGDGYLVYPGAARYRRDPAAKDLDHSLDSIRYEAHRDGAEDYELLCILAKKDRKKADDVCSMVMYNLTGYTTDPVDVNNARRALLEALQQ